MNDSTCTIHFTIDESFLHLNENGYVRLSKRENLRLCLAYDMTIFTATFHAQIVVTFPGHLRKKM